ncbi:MAG TPA: hypothetical protein PKE03_08320 [Bacteroidales bacterium]|nr:hypothetical protein [Bacteroidales bacterium]
MDELIMLLFVTGFNLLVFTRQKVETEGLNTLRMQAFVRAMLLNAVLAVFGVLFIYGSGFVYFLVFYTVSLQLIYLIVFHYLNITRKLQ